MRCRDRLALQRSVAPNLYRFYKDAWLFGFHLGSVPFIDKKRNSIKFRLSKPPGLENGQFPPLLLVPSNLTSSVSVRVPTHPPPPLKYPGRTAAEAERNFDKQPGAQGSFS